MTPIARPIAHRCFALALCLVFGLTSIAGTAFGAPPRDPNKIATPPTQFGAKKLEAARDAMQAENWDEAEKVLDELERRRPNAYELALDYQFRGYIENGRDNTEKALEWFEKALAAKGLSYSQSLDMQYQVAQLNISLEKYDKGIEYLEGWFAEVIHPQSPKQANESNYFLLALAYFQTGNYAKAVVPARKARKLGKPVPKQSTLELLVALYHEKSDYRTVGKLLKELIDLYPKKSYFLQLSGVLSLLNRTSDSLAVQQLAYYKGWLDQETELRTLAQMLMAAEMPYPAARVMTEGMEKKIVGETVDNYRLLADAWQMSRNVQKSLEPLEKAAKMATDGKIYMRLGQAYIEGENWKDAEQALQAALDKGGLEELGTTHLLIGVSRFNQDRLGPAMSAFRQASQYEKTKVPATRWVEFIDRKLAKARAQAEANAPKKSDEKNAEDGESEEASAGDTATAAAPANEA